MTQFVSFSGGQITITGATNPAVSNVALSPSTEVEIILPAGCKKFLLRSRDRKVLQVSYVAGESNTTYLTVIPGCNYSEDSLSATASLYVRSPAVTLLELVTWT